jgi:HK97 gp10 family phage protein
MPYAYRSAASRADYSSRRPVGFRLNWERIYSEIATPVIESLRIVGASTAAMAQNRAPVRKVFAVDSHGHRRRLTFRPLTMAELRAETPTFLKTLSADQRKSLRMVDGVPLSRIGQRTTVGRTTNRANTWRDTELDRQVTMRPPFRVGSHGQAVPTATTRFELANMLAQARLNKEGRRALREARLVENPKTGALRDLGRGALQVHTLHEEEVGGPIRGYDIRLGGALRKSIHRSEAFASGDGKFTVLVVAGGRQAPYAKYMEFGTRHVAARPYLRPALKHAERQLPQQVGAALTRRFPQGGVR